MARRLFTNRAEFLAVVLCTAVFSAWNAYEAHSLSWVVVAFLFLFNGACFSAGSLILRALALELLDGDDLPTQYVMGFFAICTPVCILALCSPLHPGITCSTLCTAVVAARWIWHAKSEQTESESSCNLPGILCLLVALLGATAWSRDALSCRVVEGETTVVKPFGDSFMHSYFLSRLSYPEVSRDYIQLSGTPMGFYHYGSYMIPAAIARTSTSDAFGAFNSFQVPFGIFLASLAAFALAKCWWGAWPGIAAAVVLNLPDGAWLGVQNHWFSFHWLSLISPGLNYGIAGACMCWILMFRGCRLGRNSLLILSFAGLAVCILYKAHIFVACALLLWVFPAFCMSGWSRKQRVLWGLFAFLSYGTAIYLSQYVAQVPTLQPDGSSVKIYMPILNSATEWESVRHWFERFSPTTSMKHDLFWGGLFVGTATFGLFGLAWLATALLFRRRFEPMTWWFPCLVAANYLVMILGLPLSKKGAGEPDEMLHRPFVWAFLVIAAWVGGALYFLCFRNAPPRSWWPRGLLAALLLGTLVIPLTTPRRMHQGPVQEWTAKYCHMPQPTGLVECCRYLWDQSRPADVIQDSQYDRYMLAAGLAGRRSFASGITFHLSTPAFHARVAELKTWQAMSDEASIRQFAARNGIDWLILHPGDMAAWPASILDHPQFAAQGYRVYRFAAVE